MLQPYPDSAQVMDAPDLTSAVERGVYFNWLLEIVPGTVGNVYANQLILQADRRDGLWFAGDAASSATWRPGWWCISQDPDEIRVCFAWRDGVRATERVYTRHPQFHFYSSAAAGSAAHVKLLLPLSSDGRWSRVAPILLRNAPLRQFQPAQLRTRTTDAALLPPVALRRQSEIVSWQSPTAVSVQSSVCAILVAWFSFFSMSPP